MSSVVNRCASCHASEILDRLEARLAETETELRLTKEAQQKAEPAPVTLLRVSMVDAQERVEELEAELAAGRSV